MKTTDKQSADSRAAKENSLLEATKKLSDEQCRKMIKFIKVLKAVPEELGDQLIPLCRSGLDIEQIAKMWGVEL